VICSGCGFNNQAAARFCGGCGSPLAVSSTTARQAERRVLSVIFCDMVGATALSEQIDPEDYRALLSALHATCFEVVHTFDGFLADLMGDGVVIYFGYPRAHEDDAIRSVRCALALIDAVDALASRLHRRLEVRIAVHRGRVVVGALGGAGGLQSLAVGETPNLTARLQVVARPGQVVVSDSLWRLVSRDFQGEFLGSRRLKGIQRPVEIHRIVAYRPHSRNKGSATAFFGRKGELNAVQARWQRVLAGQSQALLIRGEPGIGKSRLINQILTDLVDPNATVLSAFCSPFSVDTPYYPIVELLRSRLGLDGLGRAEQLERLRARLVDLGLPLRDALPLLALFLSIEIEAKDWPILSELSLARQRQRTLDLLFQGLTALAAQSPLLLVIEDLHWADPSTIELLDQLFSLHPPGGLLVILTARLEFRSRWSQHDHVDQIPLDALAALEAESLIRDVASHKAMPPELVRQICFRSDGNPLFLEEITLSVISSPCLVERDKTWELVQPFSADVVPASMEAALMARLDQLGEAKDLLQIGATLGREFSLDLLTAVVSIGEAEVRELMLQMVDEGFLRISGASPPVYMFKHALVQDVAYHSLLRSTRQEHHARIASVMTEQFPQIPKQRPELLAHHLSGAGQFAAAASQWQAAGQLAAERNAVNEAVEHLNRGLLDLDQLPQEEARWQLELALNTALAPVQMAAFGWASPLVETTCLRAIELAARLGADDYRFAPLWGLWSNQFVSGRLGDAINSARDVLALAVSSGEPAYAVPARHAMAYTCYYRGDYDVAIEHAEIGLELFDREVELQLCRNFQLAPTINIMTARASSLWMSGRQREGIEGMEQMVALARSLGHPPSLAAALAFLCFFCYYDRDWSRLLATAQEVHSLSISEGFAMWQACASMYRSQALLALDPAHGDGAQVVEAAVLFRQTGSLVTTASITCIITSAWLHMGQTDQALAETVSGFNTAELGEVRVMAPEILRLRGDVYGARGQWDQADLAYQHAVQAARDQGAVSLELRALTSWLRHRSRADASRSGIQSALRQLLDQLQAEASRPDPTAARQLLAALS
jgi:class 3 adenylate cyclase/tetratricopeptide (TPR) repeat protein